MLYFLQEPSKNVLRVRHSNLFAEEPLLDELLNITGFSNFSRLRCFNIDPSLITALVERWRPETHTFHLPCGECTITLEDVSLQLGLNVNGRPVTGPTYFDWDEMCGELLGKVPIVEEDMRGCELKLAWLVDNFSQLPPNPTQIQLEQYCRARILYIIGGELIPDKSNSRVHLMYLHLLRDLSRVNRYSWGSACLANLYREMCRATKPNGKAMGGCLILLQSWAWYRLPFLAPRFDGPPTYPLAKRWGQTNLIFQGVPRGDLTGYRSRLDHMEANDFKWLPYETYINNLERQIRQDKRVWSACTALICFSIIEWHQTDRVKLQFGLVQDLPQPPMNLDALHRVDKRGNQDANWASKHAQWIEYWSHRRDQVLRGPQIQYLVHTPQYMIWYRTNSRLFLSSETQLRDPRQINIQTNPHHIDQIPTPQAPMFPPMTNQPMTSQLPMIQPSMSSSYNLQPGRMSFHYEPSQHHHNRVDDLMPHRHSFSTDQSDFINNLFGTPDSANVHLNDIEFNFNQDGAGPSSFVVNDNIFPTGLTDTTQDQPTVENRGRSRRSRQPPRCGTGGHLGNL
ncbi:hypothetical protein Lal_00002022 [Lupinus albus]|nr:hypothetical protein Lal_00002022 [Lupinus albus]